MFIWLAARATFKNIDYHQIHQVSFFLSNSETSIKVVGLPGKSFTDFMDAFENDNFELAPSLDQKSKITCVMHAGDRTTMYSDTKIMCTNVSSFVDSQTFFVSHYKDQDDYTENVLKYFRLANQEVGGKQN
ncbi:MAG: hypothetical protein PHT88_00420 [Candidatus Moranbacteria bacterium]|nr:hypothetical protein [Candidatus Moranbacteria bacterium]